MGRRMGRRDGRCVCQAAESDALAAVQSSDGDDARPLGHALVTGSHGQPYADLAHAHHPQLVACPDCPRQVYAVAC